MAVPSTFPSSTHFYDRVAESSSTRYTCIIKDTLEVRVPASSISAITFTIVDVTSATTIRSGNCFNTGGGEVDEDGEFAFEFEPADMLALGTSEYQPRKVTFRVTYDRTGGGSGQINHEITFNVHNLAGVPNS